MLCSLKLCGPTVMGQLRDANYGFLNFVATKNILRIPRANGKSFYRVLTEL
jgi:hypothetical protein